MRDELLERILQPSEIVVSKTTGFEDELVLDGHIYKIVNEDSKTYWPTVLTASSVLMLVIFLRKGKEGRKEGSSWETRRGREE